MCSVRNSDRVFKALRRRWCRPPRRTRRSTFYNEIAIDATGLDHTPVPPGDPRIFGEQLGPGRSSRAMAIVHIAMFDAMDAIYGGYRSYTGVRAGRGPISDVAAVA